MSLDEGRVLRQQLRTLWTTEEVAARFEVTTMTIHNWREKDGLPALTLPGAGRPAIRYIPDEVRQWAKSKGKRLRARPKT